MDEKHISPVDRFANSELSPLPAIAPDGGFAPGLQGSPIPPTPATPENFVCLRGPCLYYWHYTTEMAIGNTAETFGPNGLKNEDGSEVRVPRQINRSCLVHKGTITDLTDELVFQCNHWDPEVKEKSIVERSRRRREFLKMNPQYKEKTNG